MILILLENMWKNKRKIALYTLLLCFLSIGVPLYGQLPNYSYRSSDSLAYQIPAQEAPVKEVRYFSNIENRYDTEDFDYKEDSGKRDAFWEGFRKAFNRLLEKIIKFLYGEDLDDRGVEYYLQVAGAFLLLVVIFLVVRWAMNSRGGWLLARTKEKLTEISMEVVEKNLHQVDFPSLIQKAEAQNDTRQSIRLYYLWLLKVLSDRGQIVWELRKTNADYVRELKDPARRESFVYLSKIYNYIWYGEFAITDSQYQEAKADYQRYINAQKTK